MVLEKNVGGIDRVFRTILGIALVTLALVTIVRGRRSVGIATAVVGAGLLFNAATQFCGMNALLGIDTCSQK